MLPRKKPDSTTCFIRPYPSANFALVHGPRPILIDSGFGSDSETTLRLVEEAGAHPRDLQCLANTHYHAAHNGGNAAFQREGTRIAANRPDAMMVNHATLKNSIGDYVNQPVEQYRVDIFLEPDMILETGTQRVHVLHTGGHTISHLSYLTEDGTFIAGGVLETRGHTLIIPFREGADAIYRHIDTLHMLTDPIIPIRRILPAHGPLITDAQEAIAGALDNLERWLDAPQDAAIYACRQLAAYHLMLTGPQPRSDFLTYLCEASWLYDYAKYFFSSDAIDFATELLAVMHKNGDITESQGIVAATAPHIPVPMNWLSSIPDTWTGRQ